MKRLWAVLALLLFAPAAASAQDDGCAPLIERALSGTATQCASVAPGHVCFGHPAIDFTTQGDAPEFSAAGHTLPLDLACCMQLSPLHPPDAWGMALMRVAPDGEGPGPTILLIGELEIQNAASFFSEIAAQVLSDTAIYAGPGSHYAALAQVKAGDALRVNACNCTQNWLRVRLDSGEIGWVPARRVSIEGDAASLPVAGQDTPVYAAMQAFTLRSGSGSPACEGAPESGALVQAPDDVTDVRLWINGVDIGLGATLFLQAQPEGEFTIEVLEGSASITVGDETVTVPAGVRVAIPLSSGYAPAGHLRVAPYPPEDIADLPLALLPRAVDPSGVFDNPAPLVIGQKVCNVISDRGETACALHFVNLDGDAIAQLTAEFVYAPQGKWEGSVHQFPAILEGDAISGDLAWDVSCSLGGANFIGPVRWSITITDESGHVSAPFEASFNCVDG